MKIRTYDSIPCTFAKEELRSYAQEIFTDLDAVDLDLYIGLPEHGETIVDKEIDEIYIDVDGGKGKIVGSNDGAVVIATYRFLRECGCRFLRPGKGGEYLPKTTLADKRVFVKERADSKVRASISEGALKFDNVYDIIDFLPKVAMNRYFFQFKNAQVFFERWYQHMRNPFVSDEGVTEERINEELPRYFAALHRRGMQIQTMGHGFTAFPIGLKLGGWDTNKIPITDEMRRCIALYHGKRDLIQEAPGLTNLCYSNPEVQEKMADFVVSYCREVPEVDVVCFYLADNINTLCECENCRDHRLIDLIFRCLNRIDEKMTEAGLRQKLDVGLYLETMWSPEEEQIKNPSRFTFTFLPISHVYHDPMPTEFADTEALPYVLNQCQRTQDCAEYMSFYGAWRKKMPHLEYLMGEYHYMWDHYLDIGYQKIARILHADIQNHDKLGFSGMQMFHFNRTFFPTAIGMYTYGHTLWNHKTDFDELSRDYFRHAYGEGWEDVYEYMEKLSATFDMKIKPGTRNYPALDCIGVIEECLALLRAFREAHPEKKEYERPLYAISWSDLALHNEYVERYLEAFLLGLRGEEEKGREQVEKLFDWMWLIENAVQPRWDIYTHAGHLLIWYDRLMKQKHAEEKGEKVGSFVGGVTENGIQD